jgi:hypothetical protein
MGRAGARRWTTPCGVSAGVCVCVWVERIEGGSGVSACPRVSVSCRVGSRAHDTGRVRNVVSVYVSGLGCVGGEG